MIHCTESLLIAPSLSEYDLNNVERHVKYQGSVVQSIISLTSSLMTNSLTVVAKVFSNTLIFLLQKCE